MLVLARDVASSLRLGVVHEHVMGQRLCVGRAMVQINLAGGLRFVLDKVRRYLLSVWHFSVVAHHEGA